MLPTPGALFTTMAPSLISQRAGVWSCAETHSLRFLPSNRMIASDGGAPRVAPGVTTGGTGLHASVACGFGVPASCAAIAGPTASRDAMTKSFMGWSVAEVADAGELAPLPAQQHAIDRR